MPSLSVRDAASVVTFPGSGPVRGEALGQPDLRADTTIVVEDGRIASLEGGAADASFDAAGCTVVAGFVDPHTHLPFHGWRADEDAARLSGIRYEQLHAGEGGIYRSARLLAEASDEEVLGFATGMARSMLERGTTTFETKSGYGLSIEAELRQLRLARRVAEAVPQTVTTTCLAAHAVPKDHMAGEWVGRVATELLPVARDEGLVTACDIYVESIAFALEHAARLSETSAGLGLQMRVHADQLEDGQAGSFAARWGFRSADHLNHTSLDAVDDIAGGDTVAVLLPGATFTLRQKKKPPARSLVDAGAIVALGTDLNPGTSPISSMPFVIALACRTYGLRPIEALAAATVNAAYVLGFDADLGRVAEGYRADLVVLDIPDIEHLPYRPDRDPVIAVVCGGELVHVAPSARDRVS
jgi:imidazolonepropionase